MRLLRCRRIIVSDTKIVIKVWVPSFVRRYEYYYLLPSYEGKLLGPSFEELRQGTEIRLIIATGGAAYSMARG